MKKSRPMNINHLPSSDDLEFEPRSFDINVFPQDILHESELISNTARMPVICG